jgi:hypothetical protein
MKNRSASNYSFGATLIIFGFAGLAGFFTYFPITDGDIFWHLAAGREMVAHKHFLRVDPFSFTLQSPEWIDLHWIFQLIVYGLYTLGGYTALLGFKLIVIALSVFLLCKTFPSKKYALIAGMCSALLFYEVRYLIDVRPILITILCMALYVYLFENARQTGNKKMLWSCVPLQMLWTNSQGLYMIGLFIVGAYWLEDRQERKARSGRGEVQGGAEKPIFLGLVFLACVLSCFVNPYGISGLLLPFKLLGRINPSVANIYSANISENVPLFSLTGYESIYRTAVLCSAALAGALMALNWKKGGVARMAHAVLFIGFLLLAVSALRNVVLFAIIIIPLIGYNATHGKIAELSANLGKKNKLWAYTGLVIVIGAVLIDDVFSQARMLSIFPPRRSISPFCFPEKIVEELKRDPVPGEMFNDMRYGGYLIWRLYPDKKVFIDTRLVIRSPLFFAEYLRLCDDPALFPLVAQKFNITQVVLSSAIFPLYLKLIKWLYQSKDWHLQYTDGSSVFFVKNGVSVGLRVDLADTNSLGSVIGDINREWEHSSFVRREAFAHFIDLVKMLDLPKSAEYIRNQARIKEF